MIVLFGSDGNTVDSRIARRFGKAAWFLVVDTDSLDTWAMPNRTPSDHDDIVKRADDMGASIAICGDIGPKSFDLMAARSMMVFRAEGLTCREALHVLQAGSLRKLDGPTLRHNVQGSNYRDVRLIKGRRSVPRAKQWYGYPAGTMRGKHRVQQYSGRGH